MTESACREDLLFLILSAVQYVIHVGVIPVPFVRELLENTVAILATVPTTRFTCSLPIAGICSSERGAISDRSLYWS